MGILFSDEPKEVYEMKQRLGIIHLSDVLLDMWRKVKTAEKADSIARSFDLFGGFKSNHGTVRIPDENVRSFRLELSDGLEIGASMLISYEVSLTGRSKSYSVISSIVVNIFSPGLKPGARKAYTFRSAKYLLKLRNTRTSPIPGWKKKIGGAFDGPSCSCTIGLYGLGPF